MRSQAFRWMDGVVQAVVGSVKDARHVDSAVDDDD